MYKILGFVIASAILISCQKEINFSSGSLNTASLLVRQDSKSSTDSSSTTYVYDANKRLVKQISTGTIGGNDITSDISFVRNSAGIISKEILKSPSLQSIGIDSLPISVYYDNNSKKYTSVTQSLVLPGISFFDSTVFIYSGNTIIGTNEFQTISGITFLASKSDYSYAGTNITNVSTYGLDSTLTMSLVATEKATYDNKNNPLKLPSGEAFVLGNFLLAGSNNPLTYQLLNANGAILQSNTSSYTYNSSNLPQTAKILDASGVTTNVTYYYQ
jgi:hypothetical protein